MSAQRIPQDSPAELVRRALAAADRRRRTQDASRAFWRAAPVVAAACVGVAVASRWRGWSTVLPLGVLALATLGLLARIGFARREHSVSDAVAAGIDEAAGFEGELRSAHWFASRDIRDAWADCHLDRAARRLGTVDWAALYPSIRAWRAVAATAILALCTVALAMTLPGRGTVWPGAAANAATARSPRAIGVTSADVLLPELQKELEALLAAAESGTAVPAGTSATAAELRSLLGRLEALRDAGKLKDLARAMTPAAGDRSEDPANEMKALADRAGKAARMPTVAPDVRDTLQNVSDNMADAARATQPPDDGPGETVSARDARKSDTAPGTQGGDVDEASIQSLSEAEAGGGAGIIMMGTKDDASGKAAPGLGLGGGSDTRTDGGRLADLEAALRRETIEASADNAGVNVQTDAHRTTEHGRATVTYARSVAGTLDRGRAVAPPPVPEKRRAAVQTYFIRRQ